MLESLFFSFLACLSVPLLRKGGTERPATLLKDTPVLVLSCEYFKILMNTYFEDHLQTGASANPIFIARICLLIILHKNSSCPPKIHLAEADLGLLQHLWTNPKLRTDLLSFTKMISEINSFWYSAIHRLCILLGDY